jgi:adenylate kinase family enzyme
MRRVLVIGSPGAGKSTFAAALARRTGLELIHLDRHYWRAGWTEPDPAEWAEEVARLTAREAWVMDGNYGGTLALRLARADTVIWLDFPVWLCLWRIIRRAVRYRGRVRPDMAQGCPERLEWEFVSYTARFPWSGRRRIVEKLPLFNGTLVHLRRPSEGKRFLAGLE